MCKRDIIHCRRLQKLNFVCTGNEIQLLLESVNQYKCKCEYEEINWESVCSKYKKNQ